MGRPEEGQAGQAGQARGHWGSRAEFLLSCIGFSVGLGNVWRFPFLAYQNGGGAFLIPYVIILVLVGKPMYFMEAALGQYAQLGPLATWMEMLPCGMGVGVAMVILSLIVSIYYNVIMAYCLHYLFNSLRSSLPWSTCGAWSDRRCYERAANSSGPAAACLVDALGACVEQEPQTAEEQYWEQQVLGLAPAAGGLGELRMELAFWLLVSWLVVLLCHARGIRTSGKVVYVTATLPYLLLLVLLVRALTLPGAAEGVHFLFLPREGTWEKLLDIQVWLRAAGQVFFSLGLSWGGVVMLGSHNRFTSPVHVDAHIVSVVDLATSLLASTVIFAILGNSAHRLGVPIEAVARGGQGLAFVAYPEALSHLPMPQLWSVLFFLTLFLLGLDSEFAMFETILAAVFDALPGLGRRRALVTTTLVLACFLLGLPCVTQGGQYVLDLMDTYGASLSVIVIAVMEVTALMWGYGVNTFCADLKTMLNFTPSIYFKVCWVFLCPVVLTGIFLASAAGWRRPQYGGAEYPEAWHLVGWALTLGTVIQVPLWFLVTVVAAAVRGDVMEAFRPSEAWLERREGRNAAMVTNISILANSRRPLTLDRQATPIDYTWGFNFD